jgi:protein SMG7
MDSIAPQHDESVVKEFTELVSDRVLSIDTITKVVIAAQGALWKHRKVSASASVSMESRIASHVLALHHALLQSGITELDEAAKIVEEDLAMRITATFRRTLPGLRIAGKWLRVNLDYVLGDTRKGTKEPERCLVISGIATFWEAYTSFATRIVLVFPPTSLPQLKRPLEEDVDSRGYLPLRGMLAQDTLPTDSENEDFRTPEQVHPNEEQLMRIWDIGHDARLIAETSRTPMESFRAQFSLIDSVGENELVVIHETAPSKKEAAPVPVSQSALDDRQSEEDARTETTDPVGDAFREVLGGPSSEDEQDKIVWNPRYVFQALGISYHLIKASLRCLGPYLQRLSLQLCRASLPHTVVPVALVLSVLSVRYRRALALVLHHPNALLTHSRCPCNR